MENIISQLQHLADEVKSYVNVRIDLLKLNVAETASSIIATTMAKVISGIIFLFFLLFGSIALSLFLSSVIGNSYSGFLIVSGIYLALGLLIWYTRKRFIQAPIMNAIIRQLFSENGKEGINRQ
jgi:hypothetical protein